MQVVPSDVDVWRVAVVSRVAKGQAEREVRGEPEREGWCQWEGRRESRGPVGSASGLSRQAGQVGIGGGWAGGRDSREQRQRQSAEREAGGKNLSIAAVRPAACASSLCVFGYYFFSSSFC